LIELSAKGYYNVPAQETSGEKRQLSERKTAMANLDALLSGIEATKLDYKVDLESEKPKSWLKSVSAFANTSGGHIIFGVENDTLAPVGLADPQYVASRIAELISARISPTPRYEINEVRSDAAGRPCIDVLVQNGPYYPYYYNHERTREAYVRHGDRSEIASDTELNNLILKGRNTTFDSLPGPYKLSDVSFTLFAATYKRESGNDLLMPRDLESFGLISNDGQVTNAGLLLCDQGYLRQSKIVCTRWKGTEKGSVDGDALDDQEYKDASLISLLSYAEAFIRNNSKNPWTIRGMRREEKSDYPFKAVREVLVNAVIHRDYQLTGSEVHVDMFDDRMEIVSPGGMLNGSRIQDLDLRHIPSIRRNEIISDAFDRLNLMDRRGSGIGRILNSYAEFAEQPLFYSNEYFFSVLLPNRSTASPAQMKFDVSPSEKNPGKSQLTTEKSQLTTEKGQLTTEKGQLVVPYGNYETAETDWELRYFETILQQKAVGSFRSKTIRNIMFLFQRYRYHYTFNRRNIAELFGISENSASQFLKKCIEKDIVRKVKIDEYQFVSD